MTLTLSNVGLPVAGFALEVAIAAGLHYNSMHFMCHCKGWTCENFPLCSQAGLLFHNLPGYLQMEPLFIVVSFLRMAGLAGLGPLGHTSVEHSERSSNERLAG